MIDCFTADLDQTGIIEMKSTFELTGGSFVSTDSFGNPVFKESFKKFFDLDSKGELKMGFLAQTQVFLSKDVKISGAIGQCIPIVDPKNNQYVSGTVIGNGGTNHWYLGGIDPTKSLAIYFDVDSTVEEKKNKNIHIQFHTKYQHVNGQMRLRVTTVEKNMAVHEDINSIAKGFD